MINQSSGIRYIFVNRYFFPDHSATSQMLTDVAFFLSEDTAADVHVVACRQRYDNRSERLQGRETVRGVHIHRMRGTSFGRSSMLGRSLDYLSFYVCAGWCLWRLVQRGDVVIAKTDPPMISVIASFVCRWRHGTLVNWLQDLFPEVAAALRVPGMNGWFARVLRRVRDGSLRSAACNVAIGEKMAQRIRGERVDDHRLRVISNWCDGTAVKPLPAELNDLRAQWGLCGCFVVGYSGNMGRAHEFETLSRAVGRLGADNAPARTRFVFIGGGHYRGFMEANARREGWQHVLFKPYQPRAQLQQSLGVADVHIVVLRPELEGFIVPSKFYGIAAAGRPVVFIGDVSGEIAGLIARYECGRVVGCGDDEALVQILRDYRDDPQSRRRHGHNARAMFERRFDKPIAMKRWQDLLEEVVGS